MIFTVVVDTDDHEQGNQWYLQYTSGATTSTCAQSDEAVTTTSSVAGTMTTYTVTVAGMISSACGNYVSIGRSRRPGELAAWLVSIPDKESSSEAFGQIVTLK